MIGWMRLTRPICGFHVGVVHDIDVACFPKQQLCRGLVDGRGPTRDWVKLVCFAEGLKSRVLHFCRLLFNIVYNFVSLSTTNILFTF